jgi:transposase-like protein
MDAAEFQDWLSGIGRLSLAQPRQTYRELALFESSRTFDGDAGKFPEAGAVSGRSPAVPETAALKPVPPAFAKPAMAGEGRADSLAGVVHRRVESMGCPHCQGHEIVLWGSASALPRYRCKDCGRTFNALTKTPLARLRKRNKWQEHSRSMIDGASIAKTAERRGVHFTTAFRWRHRFLASPSLDKPKSLLGIIESDETFILESYKGKRSDMPRAPRKRGGKAAKRGLSAEQIPVLVARDRSGATIDAVLPKLNRVSIAAALGGVVTPANQFCRDGGTAIVAFARRAAIPAHIVPAPGKPSPEAPDFHINNVNAYRRRLKEWMRRFHGVATKNLPNYLGWRRALEALGPKAKPEEWGLGAIGLGPYQPLTR